MKLPQFEIHEKDVVFHNLNIREEKHGDQPVLAIDMDFCWTTGNEALRMLHPLLRHHLFATPFAEDQDLVDQADPDALTRLLFPQIADAIRWDLEMDKCECRFPYGVQGNDIVLADCKVKNFKITLYDGGTIDLQFRVCAHPTDEQVGRITERYRTGKVALTVFKQPEKEVQPAIDGTKGPEPEPDGSPLMEGERTPTPARRGRLSIELQE